ncbi:MAG: tetratricopeptide repeat protein [Pseudomonadales bacterium]|nr:tetratricopeptide repeat protein [Pseudomonadales bacterium]
MKDLYAKGLSAYATSNYSEAKKLFARIVLANPEHADAWNMYGVCCLVMGQTAAAENFIRQALNIRPDPVFYTNLGIVLRGLRQIDGAIAAYRSGLTLNPQSAKACANLANLLLIRNELSEAETLYRQALALKPENPHTLANLGALLIRRGAYTEAEPLLRKSLALTPSHLKAAQQLATILRRTGRYAEAATLLEQGSQWGLLGAILREEAAWPALAKADAAYIESLNAGQGLSAWPWTLLNIAELSPRLQKKAAFRFAEEEYADALALLPLVNSAPPREGPLRIAYLGADAAMHMLAGVLQAHDPDKVEVHLLSLGKPPKDEGSPAAPPAKWHDLSADTDARAAARIAEIAPHLLIDLKGYTTAARVNILARRPASIIVSWLGYPATLGHERLADYIIGDPVLTPVEDAENFSETLALMPHCYQPNDRSRPRDPPPSRSAAGLPETGLVFCAFNQFIQLNPGTFAIWCRVLSTIPDSVLWLLHDNDEGVANLRHEAQKHGIAKERLVFASRTPPARHLARLRLADIALDTFPHNAQTAASDALWAGVPLVTRKGDSFASRTAASLLTAHGVADLITTTDEAYLELILSLARAPEKLRAMRERLETARLNSPLFDAPRFTRNLERLYEEIWQRRDTPVHERKPLALAP